MKIRSKIMGIVAVCLVAFTAAQAQTAQKRTLTIDGARMAIKSAIDEAASVKAPGAVIAVVDDGGNLMALERLDGTFPAGATISIGKARTAALFKKPTRVFEEIIGKGRTAMAALPDSLFTPLQGGVPIVIDGQVVGAIGVSGAASAQQDEELAIAGANALQNKMATVGRPVSFFDSRQVSAAFEKGAVLFDGSDKYMVHASRREKPGMVEVHEQDADIIYVIDGTATLITGGTPVAPKTIAPGEIRAERVTGGEERHLARGDVLIVPAGTPHWFKEVAAPFTYYVVKAR